MLDVASSSLPSPSHSMLPAIPLRFLPMMWCFSDVPSYVEKLVDECTSLPEYVEAAKCIMLVFGDADRAAQLITEGLQTGRGLLAKSCHDTLITMKELGLSEEDISAFQVGGCYCCSGSGLLSYSLFVSFCSIYDPLLIHTTTLSFFTVEMLRATPFRISFWCSV